MLVLLLGWGWLGGWWGGTHLGTVKQTVENTLGGVEGPAKVQGGWDGRTGGWVAGVVGTAVVGSEQRRGDLFPSSHPAMSPSQTHTQPPNPHVTSHLHTIRKRPLSLLSSVLLRRWEAAFPRHPHHNQLKMSPYLSLPQNRRLWSPLNSALLKPLRPLRPRPLRWAVTWRGR